MENILQYVPYTSAYKIRVGLDYVKKFVKPSKPRSEDAFVSIYLNCQPDSFGKEYDINQVNYNEFEMREMANKISPGLGNVETVTKMIEECLKRRK